MIFDGGSAMSLAGGRRYSSGSVRICASNTVMAKQDHRVLKLPWKRSVCLDCKFRMFVSSWCFHFIRSAHGMQQICESKV